MQSKLCLLHPAMLRNWISSANSCPGLMDEALLYIKSITCKDQKHLECALIIDSMSKRKRVICDKGQNKYAGYVECVGIADDMQQSLASKALVFLIVSLAVSPSLKKKVQSSSCQLSNWLGTSERIVTKYIWPNFMRLTLSLNP